MKTILLILFFVNILVAKDIEEILKDIMNDRAIEAPALGWNNKAGVLVVEGEANFDFNRENFFDNRRKFSLIAQVDAKKKISEFLVSKMNAMDLDNNGALSSSINTLSKNLLFNTFTLYKNEFFQDGKYYIVYYIAWFKKFPNIRSDFSLKEFVGNLNLKKKLGGMLFVDKDGSCYLLSFSIYKKSSNRWMDKKGREAVAKRDLVSMLKSNILSIESLFMNKNRVDYNSHTKQSIKTIAKGVKILKSELFSDKITNLQYYVVVSAIRLK